jgi:hypothetical protein
MAERGSASEIIGLRAGLFLPEVARESGRMYVERWDGDQTAWASRKLGGEAPGHPGFIQPNNRDFEQLKVAPYEASWGPGHNLVTTAGWGRLLTLAIAGTGTLYAAASTRMGVATGNTAAAASSTDLPGATGSANREWQMVTGIGTTGGATGSTAATLTFVATFGTGSANWAWASWGIDQGTTSGYGAVAGALLNYAVSAQGTKVNTATWTATSVLGWT